MARPSRPAPVNLTVLKTRRITPNMHRVTLGGEGISSFATGERGGYVKFRLGAAEGGKPIVRTYTIRNQTDSSIDVDFALHGTQDDSGPATRWALGAQDGDMILLGGPGPAKPLPEGQGPFLLIGDMTALPAISVNIEDLPRDATGCAIILIRDEADKQDIDKPEGVTIEWVVESDLGANPDLLVNAVANVTDISSFSFAWVACEFESMKLLRNHLRAQQFIGKDRLYISSYWKRGLIEDVHKKVKRADSDSFAMGADVRHISSGLQ